MTLWTIQPIERLFKLQSDKRLFGKKEFIAPDYIDGYDWLVGCMKQKIGFPPMGIHYPIWAWHQPKPDLRCSGLLEPGTKGVRLTIQKPSESVVLSDFELWHHPLVYKGFIGNNEKESIQFDHYLKQEGLSLTNFHQLPKPLKQTIIQSWDKIFDLDFNCPYYTRDKSEKSIQATFWELRLEEVIEVDYFTAR